MQSHSYTHARYLFTCKWEWHTSKAPSHPMLYVLFTIGATRHTCFQWSFDRADTKNGNILNEQVQTHTSSKLHVQ